MKAKIKRYHSPDIANLYNYQPEQDDYFSFLLQIFVGPENEEVEESFDILICTPKWILHNHDEDEIIFGYHTLIVFNYNFSKIKQKLEKYINNISGTSWSEIANQISLLGNWEFQSYIS